MCHIANTSFARSIGSRWNSLVGSVRSHRCCEYDRSFDSLLDEGPGSNTSAIERSEKVDGPELGDFFCCEVQSGLVLGTPGVDDESMEGSSLCDDLVYGFGDGVFICNVGLYSMEFPRILLRYCGKLIAGLADVY